MPVFAEKLVDGQAAKEGEGSFFHTRIITNGPDVLVICVLPVQGKVTAMVVIWQIFKEFSVPFMIRRYNERRI